MEDKNANKDWPTTVLKDTADDLNKLTRELTKFHGKRWLFRGQPKRCEGLVPSIDRGTLKDLSRPEKLKRERRSIDLFRSNVRFFASPGEQKALTDDITALLVLRHYDVPSRILDWSLSPWVAAYFAIQGNDKEDGVIWCFDEPLYEKEGDKQWKFRRETTKCGSGEGEDFDANLTAFLLKEPRDWFICVFYEPGFHRQIAQQSAYTMTPCFDRDHAKEIAQLLKGSEHYHRFVIPGPLKPELRRILRKDHYIWRGSLFPDSAGAAQTVKDEVFPEED